jgi:hypothetical protein
MPSRGWRNDAALRNLWLDSLRRGHRKVAAQRYLMLMQIEADVPRHVHQVCKATLSGMTPQESRRAHMAAGAWASMTSSRPQPS